MRRNLIKDYYIIKVLASSLLRYPYLSTKITININ